jgi:enamine deaminase RidA (YjgF/YER057c/UK114 family)
MSVYEKLKSLAITLPGVTPPVAAFVPFLRSGNLIFISGHIAKKDGKPWTGQLGADITTADGKEAARGIAIDLMGALEAATGNLDSIRRIVKLLVLVNSTPTFNEQHLVANGASELLAEVFGDRGKHARSAFGAAQIPFGSCVEIELIAEVAEARSRSRQDCRPPSQEMPERFPTNSPDSRALCRASTTGSPPREFAPSPTSST